MPFKAWLWKAIGLYPRIKMAPIPTPEMLKGKLASAVHLKESFFDQISQGCSYETIISDKLSVIASEPQKSPQSFHTSRNGSLLHSQDLLRISFDTLTRHNVPQILYFGAAKGTLAPLSIKLVLKQNTKHGTQVIQMIC